MKISELSIGHYVRYDNKVAHIVLIDYYDDSVLLVDSNREEIRCSIDLLEPIPFDESFVRANMVEVEDRLFALPNCDGLRFFVDELGGEVYIANMCVMSGVRYVHTLQSFLTICGCFGYYLKVE